MNDIFIVLTFLFKRWHLFFECEIFSYLLKEGIWVKISKLWGVWVAPSVKQPTLAFGSGHDLTVLEMEPLLGLCAHSTEPAWDSFSLCPSPACTLTLSQNEHLKKKRNIKIMAAR